MKILKFVSILIIFLIAFVSFIGCSPSPANFSKVDYSGHTYIIYDGYNYDGGVIHDPDCKNDK